jgi:hypothetical protein
MKKNSYYNNIILTISSLFCIIVVLQGCSYSFTGASVPDHIKTINVATVNDNSGYGDPRYKTRMTNVLIEEFQNDNSLELVERRGDSRLTVTITSISDRTKTLNPGEIETERQIVVSISVEYYDSVKRKEFWKKSFSDTQVYELTDVQTNRDVAINAALENIADDVLLAVVSGW